MSQYQSNRNFKTASGRSISAGQVISSSDYNALPYTDRNNFSSIGSSSFSSSSSSTSTESPITLMSDGHLGLNLGNGLSLDLSDGGLGVNVGGGFSISLD